MASGGVIFVVALLPALKDPQKPPLSTSFLTFVVLMAFCITYATLGLWLATITVFLTAIAWLILGIQRLAQTRRHSDAS